MHIALLTLAMALIATPVDTPPLAIGSEDPVLQRMATIERANSDWAWLLPTQAPSPVSPDEIKGAKRLAFLAQIARRKGLDQTQPIATELRAIENFILAEAARRRMLDDIHISDAEVAAEFAAHPALYDEYRLSHIFVAVGSAKGLPSRSDAEALAQAKAIKARLDRGEDFGALAKERSDDGATKGDGGALSSLFGANMADAFFPAVQKLAVGQVTDPVRGPQGYHLIRLEQRNRATLDTARYFITEHLRAERFRERLAEEQRRTQ